MSGIENVMFLLKNIDNDGHGKYNPIQTLLNK